MFKLIGVGIWIILVTAGATLASVYLGTMDISDSSQVMDGGIEELTSEMTSIPIMRDGDISGYIVLQLSFAADKTLLGEKKLDPMPFLKDAAFRVLFTSTDVDFRDIRKVDLDRLTADVAREANARIGAELVRNVLLQQFNFVKKEDIRTNWINGRDAPEN